MSNAIPPLVCDTPPPIDDFDDQADDDASGNESMEEDLSLPSSPSHSAANNSKNMDLPVPDDIHMEIPTLPIHPKSIKIDDLNNTKAARDCGISNLITDKEISDNNGSDNRLIGFNGTQITPSDEFSLDEANTEKDVIVNAEKRTADVESLPIECPPNDNSYRSESPPSLVLSNDSYADEFNIESNVCDSLPSLKLDSIDEDLPEFSSSSVENEISKSNDYESTEDCNVVVLADDRIEVHVPEIEAYNLPVKQEIVLKEPAADVDQPPKVDSSAFNLDESFDDFIEYTETEIQTKNTSEINEIDATLTISNSCNDENNFAADFSQFSAFSGSTVSETAAITTKSHTADLDENTFGDFPENVTATTVVVQKEITETVEDDDDFDDFGDFSDFSQSQPTISIIKSVTENVCPNIPLLLDMMFPIAPSECIQQSVTDDIKPNLDTKYMLNKTTADLKNFDNSKALDHQWLQSIGKNSLVTALGIDSRNILYSGKWNSSMPRFAANLGFNPLEPMKSDSMLQPISASASSTKTPDIPAAQFDWNNSGLVNPLDASHAHTLLLDLEQLVVVANLDKIKLDSSTYSAYPSSFASTCTTSTPPTPPLPSSSPQLSITTTTTTNQITSNDFHHHNNANVFSSVQHLTHNIYCNNPDDDHNDGDGYSSTFALFPPSSPSFDGSSYYNHSMVLDNANQFGMFDHYLDIRVQEILHEANASQNQSARIEPNWNPSNAEQTTNITTTTTAPSSIVSTTSPQSTLQVQLEQRRTTVDDTEEPPAPTSASYVIPGSGSLKETHIYTPSKTPYSIPPQIRNSSNESVECPDFDYKEAAAGIIIDENVVKKEYRDVEYNPEKFAANTSVSLASSSDDFSDFQSVPIAVAPVTQSSSFGILQPTKSSDAGIVINWPDPGNVSQLNELDTFENFTAIPNSTAQSAIANRSLSKEHSGTSTSHFDKPVIGVSPTENMFASLELSAPARSGEDEFTDFQSVEHIPSKQAIAVENQILQPAAIPWSIAPPNVHSPSTINPPLNFVETDTSKQPSLLLPQTLSPKYDISEKIPSNINWPDPGINSDEMARLEAIFPAPRTTAVTKPAKSVTASKVRSADDDEWSDFISVPSSSLAIQPITSIINQNIIKQQNDDDDWSDFVSSTPAGPNFPSWNAPPQFSSWQQQSSTVYGQSPMAQQQHFVPTIYASTIGKQSTNGYPNANSFNVKPMLDNSNMFLKNPKAPSISLIPDLGFAAPKTALNLTGRPAPRANNNFAKK